MPKAKAKTLKAKEAMRRIALILDRKKPKGAKGHAAIKRDRKQRLERGEKPSEFILDINRLRTP